jgi:hypothetical protein
MTSCKFCAINRSSKSELTLPSTISKWMLWIWFGLDGTGVSQSVSSSLKKFTTQNIDVTIERLSLASRPHLDDYICILGQYAVLDNPRLYA